MTRIKLTDKTLYYDTLDSNSYALPMSLDSLTCSVDMSDQSRVILFARHKGAMPANIKGVLQCVI